MNIVGIIIVYILILIFAGFLVSKYLDIRDKKIKKIKLSNIDVYETVKEKHYHYQCKECNSIFDIPVEDIPDDIINLNMISNENVTDCDIVFYGVCHNCLKNRKGDKENEEVRM